MQRASSSTSAKAGSTGQETQRHQQLLCSASGEPKEGQEREECPHAGLLQPTERCERTQGQDGGRGVRPEPLQATRTEL